MRIVGCTFVSLLGMHKGKGYMIYEKSDSNPSAVQLEVVDTIRFICIDSSPVSGWQVDA